MGLKNWFIRRELKGRYKAMSNDKKTTLLGVILAFIIAANVDFGKAMELDATEIGKLAGAVITAVLSYFVNKNDKAK